MPGRAAAALVPSIKLERSIAIALYPRSSPTRKSPFPSHLMVIPQGSSPPPKRRSQSPLLLRGSVGSQRSRIVPDNILNESESHRRPPHPTFTRSLCLSACRNRTRRAHLSKLSREVFHEVPLSICRSSAYKEVTLMQALRQCKVRSFIVSYGKAEGY